MLNKVMAIALAVLGVLLALKVFAASWALFLLLGLVLGVGAATGVIDRWGYVAAVIFLLLAMPSMAMRTALIGIRTFLRLVPLLLMLLGIYVVLKKLK